MLFIKLENLLYDNAHLTMMGLMKDYSRDLKKVVNLELQIYLVMMKAALIWKVTRTVDLTT